MSRASGTSRGAGRPATILFAILWLSAFVITHLPRSRLPGVPAGDKVLHAVGFFGLTGAFVLTLSLRGVRRRRRVVVAALAMVAYAAFDEITQPLFNRHAAWSDWMADILGAAAAIAAVELMLAVRPRRGTGANE